jgi:hypothetical protein
MAAAKALAVKLAIRREDALWGVVAGLRAVRRGRIYVSFADNMAVEPGEDHHASANYEGTTSTKGLIVN